MTNIYIFAIGFLVIIYIGLAVFLTFTARKFFLKEPEKKEEKKFKLIVKTIVPRKKSDKPSHKKKAS